MIKQNWDVFISYSTLDRAIIKKIIADLEKNRITYWVDFEQIDIGNIIVKITKQGLRVCQYMFFCLSHNFLKSNWGELEFRSRLSEIVNREDNKKRLIPLIIDDLKDDELPPLLKGIKNIRFSDKDAYNQFLISIKKK